MKNIITSVWTDFRPEFSPGQTHEGISYWKITEGYTRYVGRTFASEMPEGWFWAASFKEITNYILK